ncbi:hypothetical protein HYW82_03055 [Candidatus Peregrinibacteria bacterium]|nr:hypothetical protein [Candidatus Peregrinibacteria bacterium]
MKIKMIQGSITVNNKQYLYTLKPKRGGVTYFTCKAAAIAQDFLSEDIPALLVDLPELILEEKEYRKNNVIRFRVTEEDKRKIEKKAVQKGFNSVSSYVRSIALDG